MNIVLYTRKIVETYIVYTHKEVDAVLHHFLYFDFVENDAKNEVKCIDFFNVKLM